MQRVCVSCLTVYWFESQIARLEKIDFMTCESNELAVEVRGCAWPHTVARELHMCDVVADALEGTNIPVGNTGLGNSMQLMRCSTHWMRHRPVDLSL